MDKVRGKKLRREHLPEYVDRIDETTTLDDLFPRYLAELHARQPITEATETKYRIYYRTRIQPDFGSVPVTSITAAQVVEWQRALITSFATTTAHTARRLLYGLLEIARRDGIVLVNVTLDVRKMARHPTRHRDGRRSQDAEDISPSKS